MSKLLKKYYDVSKLVIWGEGGPDADNAKRPRLVFSFRDGNPRFTVYTGLTGKESVIAFPCDYIHMTATMNFLKDIIAGPPGEKIMVDSLGPVYENNKPTNDKQVKATLHAGKSKEGIIYFSVISEGRPKIVFPIKTSPFHVFRDSNKNVIPESIVSAKMALGMVDLILDIIGTSIVNYTNEEYSNGKKQGSTDPQGNFQAKEATSNKELIQDLDDLAL